MPKIGFHAPIKGGVHNALIVAKDTGCDTVQLFSRNPRGWMAKPLTLEDVLLFRKIRKQTKLSPVLIHCNYLVNLAAADDLMLQKSRLSFREEVERALLLGVDYLVVHPGSARGACETRTERCAVSASRFGEHKLPARGGFDGQHRARRDRSNDLDRRQGIDGREEHEVRA